MQAYFTLLIKTHTHKSLATAEIQSNSNQHRCQDPMASVPMDFLRFHRSMVVVWFGFGMGDAVTHQLTVI